MATIWSVFGKIMYCRAYYAGCTCGKGRASVDQRYGIEPGKVTSGLAYLIALSGIHKAFEDGRKWLKEYLFLQQKISAIQHPFQNHFYCL